MYRVRHGKIWRTALGLLVYFSILLVSGDCMAQPEGMFPVIPSEQGNMDNLTIPFELPGQLYEGSYLQFPNSFAKKEFRYTREGVILVYFYKTKGLAGKDMKFFAEKNYKISKEESNILAEHFGCLQEEEKGLVSTAWFTMNSQIIGIQVPRNMMERKELIKIGEEIILSYDKRIEQMFSTPEKCFETYLKAVNTQNTGLIMECMYNDGSERAKRSLIYLKTMVPYLSMVRIAQGRREKKEDVEFGKAEIISDDEARLPIISDVKIIRESAAFMLLSLGSSSRYYKTDNVWIPFRKIDGKWGIDLATLQNTALERARGAARRATCRSNLKQIGLALHMYAADYDEKFPDDFSALYPNYIGTAKIFKCPNDKTMSEMKEIKPDTRVSYVYVTGLTNQDSADRILAYDASPDFHNGEGRNVLFLDGHVAWYTEKEFQKLLNKNKEE